MYLAGQEVAAGPTVVFEQGFDESAELAPRCWLVRPVDNAFMVFPGSWLHGVLPSSPASPSASMLQPAGAGAAAACGSGSEHQRLTLLIAWWAHSDGDSSKAEAETRQKQLSQRTRKRPKLSCGNQRPAIGPQAAAPSKVTRKRSWPGTMQPVALASDSAAATGPLVELPIEEISPAWQPIPATADAASSSGEEDPTSEEGRAGLCVPEVIDQRFFVKSASVFRQRLLETCTAE
eukprot:SAG22_NODE_258_length_13522_cov_6.989496_3_plen_234_part_00